MFEREFMRGTLETGAGPEGTLQHMVGYNAVCVTGYGELIQRRGGRGE